MTDFDPLTTLDRAILTAAAFGGGFTVGPTPGPGGWVRDASEIGFRGQVVTDHVWRLVKLGYRDQLNNVPCIKQRLTDRSHRWP